MITIMENEIKNETGTGWMKKRFLLILIALVAAVFQLPAVIDEVARFIH